MYRFDDIVQEMETGAAAANQADQAMKSSTENVGQRYVLPFCL